MWCSDMIPSEEQIRLGVLRELQNESRLKDAIIAVSVMDGTVTLTGAVACQAELLAALEAARSADGVFDVVNHLRVNAVGARPTDHEIAGKIRGAFESGAVTVEHPIQVAVSNGWVALLGKVELPCQLEEAGRIARSTDGVRGVYNLIEVSPRAAGVKTQQPRLRGSSGAARGMFTAHYAAPRV
ncbi:MAG TPA: BON domain-containing protein [Pyrinomonadaceae bacterium]|nr:BON domain-containing protein [Pyrinomonadaceae bacterium]